MEIAPVAAQVSTIEGGGEMKRYFTQYNWALKRVAKEWGISADEMAKLWKAGVEALPDRVISRFNIGEKTQAILCAMESAAYLDGTTHYFIETEELSERLPDMVRHVDGSMVDFISETDAHGIIHTCGKTPMAVFFAFLDGCVFVTDGGGINEAFSRSSLKTDSRSLSERLRLLFGLALYIRHFPHAIKPGFPEFAKHPAHYKGEKCSAVVRVPEIFVDRDSPSPHYRNGHFRYLSSPRFSKMRFQTIWVDETFIRGTAKTVTEI